VTDLNDPWTQTQESKIAEDANVLITISTSEAEGMIRRWGVIGHAIGDLSVEALVRGAVDDRVLELLRAQRPHQHASEQPVVAKVKSILDSGYRMFVRDSNDPIDSARAGQIQARSLLARGNPEYPTGSFYVLHLTVEPFGPAGPAAHRDDAGAASACDALRREMGSPAGATLAPGPTASSAVTAMDAEAKPLVQDEDGVGICLSEVAAAAPTSGGDDVAERHASPAAEETVEHAATMETGPEACALLDAQPASETAAVSAAVEEPAQAATAQVAPAPEEVAPAPEEAALIEVYEAQPKKHVTKAEVLMEQFRPKVAALDFRGLFVGNFGFQRDTVVDVTKLSALSPQTVSAYLMKANSLRQSGEHEKALSYYRVLLKSDPDNADYRFLYGKTLIEMGRIQPARECLERARELGHENAAHELEQLEDRAAKKPALAFLQFWRRAEVKR
jgi:hypothetical protein